MINVYGTNCLPVSAVQEALNDIARQFPHLVNGPLWVRVPGRPYCPVTNVIVLPSSRMGGSGCDPYIGIAT